MDTYSKTVLQAEREIARRLVSEFHTLTKEYIAEVVAGRQAADATNVVRVWRGIGGLIFIPVYFRRQAVFSVTTIKSVYGVNSAYSRDVFHVTSKGELVYPPFNFQRHWMVGSPENCTPESLQLWIEALRDRLESKKRKRWFER